PSLPPGRARHLVAGLLRPAARAGRVQVAAGSNQLQPPLTVPASGLAHQCGRPAVANGRGSRDALGDRLSDYVAGGGELLVTGGDKALGQGEYYASRLEELL